MVTAKQYYQHLYNSLFLKHLGEFQKCLQKDSTRNIVMPNDGEYLRLNRLLYQINEKYGFNMKLNYPQLYLWQKNFLGYKNDEALLSAGKYVLFCCLGDNILDSIRFTQAQKELVCRKMMIISGENFTDKFSELDILLQDFISFYDKREDDPIFQKNAVEECIRKAFISEEHMFRSPLDYSIDIKKSELPLLIDKSVEFSRVTFLTASYGFNTRKSLIAAENLGIAFWLIDDLCDFVEDIREHRKNSLLVFCVEQDSSLPIEKRVEIVLSNLDKAILKLEDAIGCLKELVDEEFYCYILSNIWRWSLKVHKALSV